MSHVAGAEEERSPAGAGKRLMSDLGNETIAAVATPPGEGGVAIVRISGSQAVRVASRIFRGRGGRSLEKASPWKLLLGDLVDPTTDEPIDEVLAVRMPAGRSYTGEPTVEIHGHGGRLVIDAVLGATLKAGARLAEPGEFTKRAFLSGRLDLTQAEAVAQLIAAESENGRRLALVHLHGGLTGSIQEIRRRLLDLIADMESILDLEEDEGAEPSTAELERIAGDVRNLTAAGRNIPPTGEGLKVVFAGRTNSGKSSLFNKLLNFERSIVTSLPGTTRDYVEGRISTGGGLITLIDTAGLRSSDDPAEVLGMLRSRRQISEADLILFLIDGSLATREEDALLPEELRDRSLIVVINKADLPMRLDLQEVRSQFPRSPIHVLSARTGEGCQSLKEVLSRRCRELLGAEIAPRATPNRRQRDALERAGTFLDRAVERGFRKEYPLDQTAADLRSALDAIGEITGETATEDILERIFSRFCVGK